MDELVNKVRELKLQYENHPQKELLVAMPNPYTDRDYKEEVVTSEFTTLCPLNPGQPDYAKLTILYVPDQQILELKSLKFYLTSYRMVEIFFEEATNRILDDLVNTINPKMMEVIAGWNVRGGIGTTITASYDKR